MSITDDLDSDALISHLPGPLSPPARAGFRAAAEDALTRVPCWGEVPFTGRWRPYNAPSLIRPPTVVRIGTREFSQASKLKAAPAIEHGGDLRHVRYRKHAR
jgi:hypothetical protein